MKSEERRETDGINRQDAKDAKRGRKETSEEAGKLFLDNMSNE